MKVDQALFACLLFLFKLHWFLLKPPLVFVFPIFTATFIFFKNFLSSCLANLKLDLKAKSTWNASRCKHSKFKELTSSITGNVGREMAPVSSSCSQAAQFQDSDWNPCGWYILHPPSALPIPGIFESLLASAVQIRSKGLLTNVCRSHYHGTGFYRRLNRQEERRHAQICLPDQPVKRVFRALGVEGSDMSWVLIGWSCAFQGFHCSV